VRSSTTNRAPRRDKQILPKLSLDPDDRYLWLRGSWPAALQLLGQLQHCLTHRCLYDPACAWPALDEQQAA
jgi:hypothetical protein